MKQDQDQLRVGLIYNLKPEVCAKDLYEEYDEPATIEAVTRVLEELGFKVICIPFDKNFFQVITGVSIGLAFNMAEGIGPCRGRESQIPCVLESLSIPYTGSDALSLGIALDKYLTYTMLKSASLDVAELHMVEDLGQIGLLNNIFQGNRSYIVKPRWEGSSKGIFLTSVVTDKQSLAQRIEMIINTYHQPAIIEEFLPNDEITVGLCGYKNPCVLGMMKIGHKDPKAGTFIYSLEVKRDWQKRVQYTAEDAIARPLRDRLVKTALSAYKILELRDVARIDFRLGRDNIPKIIDINPLPGLSEAYSDLPILFRLAGGTYKNLIARIMREALIRYDIAFPQRLISELTPQAGQQ